MELDGLGLGIGLESGTHWILAWIGVVLGYNSFLMFVLFY